MTGQANHTQAPQGAATGQVAAPDIDFGEAAPREGRPSVTTVHEQILLNTFQLRRAVAFWILATFVVINVLVMFGLYKALLFDFSMLTKQPQGYHRFITGEVIASVLGATTVQLGAIMFAVAKFLFPSNNKG